MVVANSFFEKSEAHLLTFQIRGHNTQIDYLVVRRGRPRILWKNLKGEAVETFRANVSEKLSPLEDVMFARNADQMWNTFADVIRDVAKDSLGVASESAKTYSTHMESWWFCKEVQTKVAMKQSRFKELLACRDGIQDDIDLAKEMYKAAKREAKIVVARAKDEAYEDLYKKLDSKEGANDIYKIAKAQERKRQDIGNVRYIKNKGGRTTSRPEKSGEVGSSRQQMHYDWYYSRINQEKVRDALQRMGRNKVVGPDQIPIEAWRCLEDEGVKWLTCLFNKIFLSAKMPNEWRLSEVIPIYKNKGDAQACSNYRVIKLLSHTMKLWERVIERREALEDNGLQVSREKTKYLRCDFSRYEVAHQEVDIRIGDQILQLNESFRYLGLVIHRSGRIDEDVAHRIGVGWMKWREASGVLCDRRIPLKLKGKIYKVAIRPAMLFGSECCPITKAQNRVEVAKSKMLRWTCGKTMVDMIPNGVFRVELDVDYIIDKMREERLRWFRHVRRRPQSALVRRVEAMLVEGSRRRGRPKHRWEDRLKQDMKELLLSEDMTFDRNKWRDEIRISG
nr:hypothetical protein [Tanacetum cinerariifolium]